MNRIYEDTKVQVALAPAEMAKETETATAYIDGQSAFSMDFVVNLATVDAGATVKVELFAGNVADGSDATAIGTTTKTFTDAVGDGVILLASADVNVLHGRYYAVKVTHSNESETILGVTVMTREKRIPAMTADLSV